MNEAQFLLSLGMQPMPRRAGLAAPALVPSRRLISSSAMVETPAEIDAAADAAHSVADRSFPYRGAGQKL